MKQPDEPEDVAVPKVDIVAETTEGLGEAGAEALPEPHQVTRPGTEKRPRTEERQPDEGTDRYDDIDQVGGTRGPQDPGPWGSDEALRGDPAWGSSQDDPMNEGSE